MRRYVFPLVLGLVGCGILLSLGVWQVRRLAEKEAYLAGITARIGGPVVSIPPAAELRAALTDPAEMSGLRYLPVAVDGATTGQDILVLTGQPGTGGGYEVISAFVTREGQRVLLDRGFLREGDETAARPPVTLTGTGNLDWPSETDRFTPAPDPIRAIWFARDVAAMSAALGTDPVLIVARELTGDTQGIAPAPIGTDGIPNNHLNYAITWFSMAAAWAGMTAFLLSRIRQSAV